MAHRGRPRQADLSWCVKQGTDHYLTPKDGLAWVAAVATLAITSEDLGWGDQTAPSAGDLRSPNERKRKDNPSAREWRHDNLADLCRQLRIEPRNFPFAPQKKLLSTEQVDAIKKAFRCFGPDALWTSDLRRQLGRDPGAGNPDADFDELRSLMRPRLARLWRHAQHSRQPLRKRAVAQLKEVLDALVPEQRGRKEGPNVDPPEQIRLLYDQLLRWALLEPARRKLYPASPTPTLNSATKLARLYQLPKDQVKRYFRIDAAGVYCRGRKETPYRMALWSTAKKLRITEATLEKELSEVRRRTPTSK